MEGIPSRLPFACPISAYEILANHSAIEPPVGPEAGVPIIAYGPSSGQIREASA